MLYSMTGYGKAEKDYADKKISVEIKSLNSKFVNVGVKLPPEYNMWELDIRKLVVQHLIRGKIDLRINVTNFASNSKLSIDNELAKKYFSELQLLSKDIGYSDFKDYLPILLKMPDVIKTKQEYIAVEDKKHLFKLVNVAINSVNDYRKKEGKALEEDFHKRNTEILLLLDKITVLEKERRIVIRKNLENKLKEWTQNIDKNRLEQEMVYYIEKLDITEEIIRLKENCLSFSQTLNAQPPQGKKLGFIAQEMGREINTIGAKANYSKMQKKVVLMKDELEKIKEQLANVL